MSRDESIFKVWIQDRGGVAFGAAPNITARYSDEAAEKAVIRAGGLTVAAVLIQADDSETITMFRVNLIPEVVLA